MKLSGMHITYRTKKIHIASFSSYQAAAAANSTANLSMMDGINLNKNILPGDGCTSNEINYYNLLDRDLKCLCFHWKIYSR